MQAHGWVLGGALALYAIFLLWWGGRGRPLSEAEKADFLARLQAVATDDHNQAALDEVRQLIAKDDGREFIMQNLARYRPRALYPAGSSHGTDPRAADRRYGRLIIRPLLRNGSLPLFIARRTGSFIEPEGADAWHYVAMVRYRSKRDFLRFALAISSAEIVVHKWAALEKTHVFPVQPVISLFMIRTLGGLLLGSAAVLVIHFL